MPDTPPSSTDSKMAVSMEQKEQAWTTWWASRPLCGDDGSQSVWEKEQAVLREKKIWWFYTYGERYRTQEEKEEQWRDYWEKAHGEYSEPLDGYEKTLWWRHTFGEEYVRPRRGGAQIAAMRSVALRCAEMAAGQAESHAPPR